MKKLYSAEAFIRLICPVTTGWIWHLTLYTQGHTKQVVKASSGHFPLPFLISDAVKNWRKDISELPESPKNIFWLSETVSYGQAESGVFELLVKINSCRNIREFGRIICKSELSIKLQHKTHR